MLDAQFSVETLEKDLRIYGCPLIFNTDQDCQFRSQAFTKVLGDNNIRISIDGRGYFRDNIVVKRLWRTVNYQYLYLHAFENGSQLRDGFHEAAWLSRRLNHIELIAVLRLSKN